MFRIKGKFASFKSTVKKALLYMGAYGLFLLGVCLVLWGYVYFARASAPTNYEKVEVEKVVENPQKIAEVKDMLATIVHRGESTGKVLKDGEIYSVFDPSEAMKSKCLTPGTRPIDCESYGPYQIKIGTLRYFAKQVYGHEVTELEAMRIANDNVKAKEFFLECSIKVTGCVWHWTAAKNNRSKVEVLVEVIRKLEK